VYIADLKYVALPEYGLAILAVLLRLARGGQKFSAVEAASKVIAGRAVGIDVVFDRLLLVWRSRARVGERLFCGWVQQRIDAVLLIHRQLRINSRGTENQFDSLFFGPSETEQGCKWSGYERWYRAHCTW
jgi:hypothetical protein